MRHAPLLVLVLALSACSGEQAELSKPSATPTPSASPPPVEPVDPLSPRPAVESPAPTAQGRPTCAARTLTVQDADLIADDEHLQEVFAVRTSGPTCQLRGWPEVTLLGSDDVPIRVTARRTGTAQALSLSKGTSLSFVLGTPRTSDCEDVATLLVRLPGTSRTIRTGTTMQVCHGELTVGPVERRQDDEGSEH